MEAKKMKKDLLVVTALMFATVSMLIIGYFAVMNTLQLWDTFLNYLAQGQNVSVGLLVNAIAQNVGLQIVSPFIGLYGCFVLANYLVGQTNLRPVRFRAFWFGVVSLALGALMFIIPTPQYGSVVTAVFIIPGLLVTFLSMEKPAVATPVVVRPVRYRHKKKMGK